jgi:hypothetical protein
LQKQEAGNNQKDRPEPAELVDHGDAEIIQQKEDAQANQQRRANGSV